MTSDLELFAAVRSDIDRQSFNRLLKELGVDRTDSAAYANAKMAYASRRVLLDEQLRAFALRTLSQSLGNQVHEHRWTVWSSVYSPSGGISQRSTWGDYARWHQSFSGLLVEKGEGIVYAPVLNANGHRCNASTLAMTAINLDADGTGDWWELLSALRALGLAFLAHRSGGHSTQRPKWRVVLPLDSMFVTPLPEGVLRWRMAYLTSRVAFGALARLQGPGFDPATDGPHHPWYPGSRRNEADPPREVFFAGGATLSLPRLLAQLPAFDVEPRTGTRSSTSNRSPTPSLLLLAFEEAGLLGADLGAGRTAVVCPWNDFHSEPLNSSSAPTSSTILWPANSPANIGGFTCLHRCGSPSAEDVLDALPADAVWRARQRHVGAATESQSSSLRSLTRVLRLPSYPSRFR